MHEFRESNRIIHKVCHLNRFTNCNAVLGSPAAKLFGWLSMSDIGLCYFVGSIFSLILAGIAQQTDRVIPLMYMLALCAFPYTVFSLWYQFFKVKKICPLCLGIIGVLWVEMALAVFNRSELTFVSVSPETVFSLLAGFAVPVMAWVYVKPLWKEYIRIRNFEYQYLLLKRTPEVISAMLAKESACDMGFSQNEIHLGTVDAPMHVTVVLSFHCQPCADGWNILNRLLATYSDSLWVTIRFFGYNLLGMENKELINGLNGVYHQSGNDVFREALTDWYKHKDYQKWKSKYLDKESVAPKLSCRKNAGWERMAFITGTPAIFVNDRKFPFMMDDLEYLLKAK